MTTTDVRLFIEVTTRQAEEAFRRQMEESNRRIEAQMMASRVHAGGNRRPEVLTQPRELWWSKRERHSAASHVHADKERNQ
jgi:hypothetical protein